MRPKTITFTHIRPPTDSNIRRLNRQCHFKTPDTKDPTNEQQKSSTSISKMHSPSQQSRQTKTSIPAPEDVINKYEKALIEGIQEIERLNHLLTTKQTQMSAVANQCEELKSQLASLKDSFGSLQKEKDQLQRELSEKCELFSQFQQQKIQEEEKQAKIHSFHLLQIEKDKQELLAALEEEKQKNQRKNKQISKLTERIREIEDFMGNLKAKDSFISQNSKILFSKEAIDEEVRTSKKLTNQNNPNYQTPQPKASQSALKSNLALNSRYGSFITSKDDKTSDEVKQLKQLLSDEQGKVRQLFKTIHEMDNKMSALGESYSELLAKTHREQPGC